MKTVKKAARGIVNKLMGAGSADRASVSVADLQQYMRLRSDPVFRESVRRLRYFRNRHEGKRCFIIGNGPSLNRTDLGLLKGQYTFGLNRVYLLFDKLGFSTTYYVAVNKLVVEQCAAEINGISCQKFIGWASKDALEFTSGVAFLRSIGTPRFCKNAARQGVWEGATVTYVAMQLAYHMGFAEAVLVGVDHSFKTQGEPHKLIVSEGADENHFSGDYFGKGFKWQLPDLETSELAYGMAKEAFEADGRRIIDATVGGKLTVFPKARLEDLIDAGTP